MAEGGNTGGRGLEKGGKVFEYLNITPNAHIRLFGTYTKAVIKIKIGSKISNIFQSKMV